MKTRTLEEIPEFEGFEVIVGIDTFEDVSNFEEFIRVEESLGGYPMPDWLLKSADKVIKTGKVPLELKQKAETWLRGRLQFQKIFNDTGVPGSSCGQDIMFYVECQTDCVFCFLRDCGFFPDGMNLDDYRPSDNQREILVCHDVPCWN